MECLWTAAQWPQALRVSNVLLDTLKTHATCQVSGSNDKQNNCLPVPSPTSPILETSKLLVSITRLHLLGYQPSQDAVHDLEGPILLPMRVACSFTAQTAVLPRPAWMACAWWTCSSPARCSSHRFCLASYWRGQERRVTKAQSSGSSHSLV